MADTKISDLAAVTDLQDTDELVLARAGTTKKIDGVDLKSEVIASATAADIPIADAGGLYTDADVEAALQEVGLSGLWQGRVIKAVTESVSSSTVVQADDELFFPVVNGESYEFKAFIAFDEPNNSGTPDFKWRFAPASGSQIAFRVWVGLNLSFTATVAAVLDSTDVTNGADGNKRSFMVEGGFTAFANTNYQFQWSQNTSSGNAVRVLAGSYLVWRRIV